ncbi:MFS family permease [Mycetocola sp. BIGb0189]|uniref:MFS transporter n=1 Tax=Mycetocola sp. BIGb0189 TaxID=2940604 RepID=UPI002166CE66|nr:MFS transporter [Mycetocola sp. BIGb0189]MCS4275880.1 MFS family permease [Mycetocola sp. BIGb0189]
MSHSFLTARGTALLAVSTGLIAANLYYIQPLIPTIAADLGIAVSTVQVLLTASQLGFALGILLILPLGDLIRPRTLITVLLSIEALALVTLALSTNAVVLGIAVTVVGITNLSAQVIVPAAANLAAPGSAPRVVSTVIGGLLTGILLARTVAGLIATPWGWRPVFIGAAILMVALIPVLRRVLGGAARPAAPGTRYSAILAGTVRIFRAHPELRIRSLYGALMFALFSLLWSTLALLLERSPYGYSEAVIGLFGLLGVAGALCATLLGRIRGLSAGTRTALLILVALIGAVALSAGATNVAALIVGILLVDVAVQGIHVTNQHVIYAVIAPSERGRANGVYMAGYFGGGVIGTALATLAWGIDGWSGVATVGIAIVVITGIVRLFDRPRTAPTSRDTAQVSTHA